MKRKLINLSFIAVCFIATQLSSCKKDNPTPAKNSDKTIISFTFATFTPQIKSVISGVAITAIVPAKTDITSLVPTIVISPDATVTPASGTPMDFTNPVTYTVTAQDGSMQTYTMTVTVALSSAKQITAFSINSLPYIAGVIDEATHTISFTPPPNTDVTNLIPTITISPDATLSPGSGSATDYTNPVSYVVTAQDGSNQTYVVNINWVNAGLSGLYVTAVLTHGDDIFAGTFDGGIFLSNDNGLNWKAMNNGLTSDRIYSLAISGNKLFAGTGAGSIVFSTDNGTSWSSVNGPDALTYSPIYSIAANGNKILAGAVGGVFLSEDAGVNWVLTNLVADADVSAFGFIGNNIFAGTSGFSNPGIFLSSDEGASWTPVNSGLTTQYVYALVTINNNIFAATSGGIFTSDDNGANWHAINYGLKNYDTPSLVASGSVLVAGSSDGNVFTSQNNGALWTLVNLDFGAALNYSNLSVVDVNDDAIIIGTYGGIFVRPL